jgi:isoleucyl-tRNA synthetase
MAGKELAPLLRRHEPDLRYIFIVSQVDLQESLADGGALEVEVTAADGQKCERCGNYSLEVGKNADFSTLCERCIPVVRGMTNVE